MSKALLSFTTLEDRNFSMGVFDTDMDISSIVIRAGPSASGGFSPYRKAVLTALSY